MPSINCSICGKVQRIPTGKWKLILSDEPYICSAECVKRWICSFPVGDYDHIPEVKYGAMMTGTGGSPFRRSFRSFFEEKVYAFLESLVPAYEPYAFPVGNGFYIPDFYFPYRGCFVETKGLWRLGQKKKFRAFKKQYPNIPILIIPWTLQSEF